MKYYKFEAIDFDSFLVSGKNYYEIECKINYKLINSLFKFDLFKDIFFECLVGFYNSSNHFRRGSFKFKSFQFTNEYGKIIPIKLRSIMRISKDNKIDFEMDLFIGDKLIRKISSYFKFIKTVKNNFYSDFLDLYEKDLINIYKQLKEEIIDYLFDSSKEDRFLLCFIHSKKTIREAMINTNDSMILEILEILKELEEKEFKKEIIKEEFK